MQSTNLPESTHKNQRISNWVSFILIAGMMVCFSISLVQLLKWFTHGFSGFIWGYIPFLSGFYSLVAILTRPIARALDGREKVLYFMAEWVILIFVVKFIYFLVRGFNAFLSYLTTLGRLFSTFFSGETAIAIVIVGFIWLFSRSLANNIEELNIDPTDTAFDLGKLQNSRKSIRGELVNRILWMGIFMVILTSLVRYAILYFTPNANLHWPVANVIVYFFFALVLFSQTQFSLLRTRWFWHQMPIPGALAVRWLRFGLLFFAFLAVVAFVLPTEYSLGLLDTLNYALGWLVSFVTIAVQLIFLPVIWLLSLAGCSVQSSPQTPTPAPVTPPPLSPGSPAALPWLQILESIIFWALLIGIVGYAFVLLLRQNFQISPVLRQFKFLHWLSAWISAIRQWLQKNHLEMNAIWQNIQKRIVLTRAPQMVRQVRQWMNFRLMTPRQQIVFYYLQVLKRGESLGIKRETSETPTRYATTLEQKIPEAEQDIKGITDQFLDARYSLHVIDTDHTNLVQRFWRNIARAINRRAPSS